MNQTKKKFSIGILAIILTAFVNLSFAAANVSEGSDENIISNVGKLLTEITVYDYGQSRESLTAFDDLINSAIDSQDLKIRIEKELINFLNSDATFAGKQFICRQLSIIGTAESVPVLSKMLFDEKTSDIAMYALERIPGTEVNKALNEALSKVKGKVKIGIINSLGQRRDAMSVGKLEKLIYDTDSQAAQSAVDALGKIADNNAAKALEKAKSQITGELRRHVLDAYMRCADKLSEQGDGAKAVSIYQEIYNQEESTPVRAAALRGFVQTNKDGAIDFILTALRNDNPELQSVAISLISELPETFDLKKIIAECSKLSDLGQVQLLTVFSDRSETAARRAVLDAAKHKEEAVRVAALKSLAKVGNESDIALLARIAAETKGADCDAARESLYLLRGSSIDQTIVAQIPNADFNVKVELIRSVSERNIVDAAKTLLKTACDSDLNVRRESIKALAVIAQPEYIGELIQILINEKNTGIRKEAEKTVIAVAQKIQDKDNQAKPVLSILPEVEDISAKSSLLQVLGRIGDKNALPVLRDALKSENADYRASAIRALSVWSDTEPLDDLLNVAKTSDNETHKILALRGFIDLLKIDSDRSDKESLNLYLTAMELATELNEKRMVLSGLAALHSMEVLETTVQYLDDPAIQPEAEAAVVTLVRNIRNADNLRVKEILKKVLAITNSASLRERITGMLERMK